MQDFTVEGGCDFPLDMLRFDECWPVGCDAVQAMAYMVSNDHTGKRRIHLRSAKMFGCTPKRWASFLWRVIAIDGMPV